MDEIQDAVDICRRVGNNDIVLLKCTSAYPAPLEDANLLTIADMRETFGVNIGFSDHTLGYLAPVVAVTLGAKVIEKHFILDKSIGGADASFSLDYQEFAEMVKAIRECEKLLGTITYNKDDTKIKGREFSRSLYVSSKIKKGELFSEANIKSVRPSYGLHPKYLKDILGKEAKKDYEFGTPLALKDIKGN